MNNQDVQKIEKEINAEHINIASNSVYLLFRFISKFFVTFVVSVLFVRFLGATNYGIFSIVTLYWGLFMSVMAFGFGNVVQYGIAKYRAENNLKKASWITKHYLLLLIVSTSVGSIIMFISANPIAALYRIPQMALLIQLLAIGLVFYSISETFVESVYLSYQRLKYTFYKGIVFDILRIIQIIIVILGFGLIGAIAFYTVLYVITAAVAIYFVYRIIKPVGKPVQVTKTDIKKLSNYNWFSYISNLIAFFYGSIISLILGFFAPNASFVSFYRVGLLLASMISIPAGALGGPFFATTTRYFETKQFDKFYRLMNTILRYIGMITIPLIIGSFVAAGPIIQYLYHASLLGAETPFLILLISVLITSLLAPIMNVLSAIGKQKYFMYSNVVGAIIGISLNIALVPLFLANGAAAVYLFSNLGIVITNLYFVSRYIKIKLPYIAFLKSTLASVLMAVFIYFVLNTLTSLALLPLVLIAGLIIYVIVIYSIRLLTKKDIIFLLKFSKIDKFIRNIWH